MFAFLLTNNQNPTTLLPALTKAFNRHTLCSVHLEFDPDKEALNLAKHGVDFSNVAKVFADPKRLVVPNRFHSSEEDRFYAIGHDGLGVLTVRFTLRMGTIRVIGAGYWRKQRRLYEKAQTELHE